MEHPVHTHPHFFKRPDQIAEPLYILTMISNPIRYRSRWKLFSDWKLSMEALGGIVYVAEVQFGEREFCVTDPANPRDLQLHTDHELWHKENAINLLMHKLPLDWKYVAWIDADVSFARKDILNETVHQLQHYDVVQMWSEAQDLDPDHQVIMRHKSFMWGYVHGDKPEPGYMGAQKVSVVKFHPGFAWAARRSAINSLGGLIDFAVLGSADRHMADALIGQVDENILAAYSERYKFLLQQWQARAEKDIKRNVGYVPGLVLHYWHGSKADRRYIKRWHIMSETGFDPDLDLRPDWQGLWQLTDRSQELRDRIRAYMRARDEDSTYVETSWADSMMKGKK